MASRECLATEFDTPGSQEASDPSLEEAPVRRWALRRTAKTRSGAFQILTSRSVRTIVLT